MSSTSVGGSRSELEALACSADDFVASIRIGEAQRRAGPSLPARAAARFIRARVRAGGRFEVVWLVKSLLDAGKHPAAEIARPSLSW